MTDEQILKRLAEIESLPIRDFYSGNVVVARRYQNEPIPEQLPHGRWTNPSGAPGPATWEVHWNPLTNWSDLGPLIEKYRLCIIHCEKDDTWTVFAGENCQTDYYESLPHAICLAIIEANGGMGDE